MRHFRDSFHLASEPQTIATRLIETCEEFLHIQEAAPRIAVVFSERTVILRGSPCAAVIVEPRWQGPLSGMTEWLYAAFLAPVIDQEDVDYLILVDRPQWDSLDAERRERLMFHELSHVVVHEDEFGAPRRSRETGKPVLKLGPHDTEVFTAEILRYGPHVVDLEEHCHALVEGEARARRRRFKVA